MKLTTALLALTLSSSASAAPFQATQQDLEINKRVAPAVAAGIFGVAGGTALNADLTGVVKGATSGGVKNFANEILGNPPSKRQAVDPVIPTAEVWSFHDLRATFARAVVEKLFEENAGEGEAAVCVSVEYEVEHDEKAREVETVKLGNGEEEAFFDCFLLAGPSTFKVVGENSNSTVAVKAPIGAWNATEGAMSL